MPEQPGKHVVIVGGGFAGLKCATALASHRDLQITLLDRNNYQQFQPLLYQVAASLLSPTNAAFSLRDILRDHGNVDVQMTEVVSMDLAARSVTTADGHTLSGDFLVLATGSAVNFYATPGAEQNSFPLYSLTDAEKLRDQVLKAFEAADRGGDQAPDGLLNFVVVGGGPTGVEMAGTLQDLIDRVLKREFRHVDASRAKVFLIERNQTVLSMFAPASQSYAIATLKKRGVDLRTGTAVEQVTPHSVSLSDGSVIPTGTVIWAAGLRARTIPSLSPVAETSGGRIPVNQDLSLAGFPGVYIAGDLANALGSDGKPLPQLAAVAQQAGKSCAENILAAVHGKPTQPYLYHDRGILAMVGRNAAIAELGSAHHQLTGTVAFAAWLGIHTVLLTVARAKLEAIVEWSWEYFTNEHPGQLIDR